MYLEKVKNDYLAITVYSIVYLILFVVIIPVMVFLGYGHPVKSWFNLSSQFVPLFMGIVIGFQILGLPYALLKHSNLSVLFSAMLFGLLSAIVFILSVYLAGHIESALWHSENPKLLAPNNPDFYYFFFTFFAFGIVAYILLSKQSPNKALNQDATDVAPIS